MYWDDLLKVVAHRLSYTPEQIYDLTLRELDVVLEGHRKDWLIDQDLQFQRMSVIAAASINAMGGKMKPDEIYKAGSLVNDTTKPKVDPSKLTDEDWDAIKSRFKKLDNANWKAID